MGVGVGKWGGMVEVGGMVGRGRHEGVGWWRGRGVGVGGEEDGGYYSAL